MNRATAMPRAVTFVDGQNLFYAARDAFGYAWPNYDVRALAERVVETKPWRLEGIRFYTGIPPRKVDSRWKAFWGSKLKTMARQGIHVSTRNLTYRTVKVSTPTGVRELSIGMEKGIDVRIAIDVIRMAHHRAFDVAVIFSQDQDFVEVAREIREIAREQGRWIKIASAFPRGAGPGSSRGIDETDWIPIERAVYDSCLDSRDHRPRGP